MAGMSADRAKLLGELLTEVVEQHGCRIPDEAWGPYHKLVKQPYAELCMVRSLAHGEPEILLTHRKDEYWAGWHIPGSMWRVKSKGFQEACEAVSRQELDGAAVRFVTELYTYPWSDHPYGNPISHVCIAVGEVPEKEDQKYFSKLTLPLREIVVNHHHDFAWDVLSFLETDRWKSLMR
ncbi:MAG: hypothetical protein A2928_03850 [Candidatus Taylorbacteria bacterium RIFCSPLOWO2_01_FULL_45_15b]|uniref:Nudix hydrolase domain-containing protein n=1 Tax=Candidatus Taylorbacteria bacterium RIFCSPLOWO2_01_FULL_45_15b TaxID=1802319 RepID=A0A1G2NGX2_9BACT|nr:MAG: hypothetical protein A2928_03850 [Candidatus Taylorbacteria bacterium RIFCSPLOWO2_01_FULL_45_15b]